MILEWVDGWTLASVVQRRGRLPAEEVVEIACQTLAALEVANQHGIVHRDIKPSNLMLTTQGADRQSDGLRYCQGYARGRTGATVAYPDRHARIHGTGAISRRSISASGPICMPSASRCWLLTGSRPYRDPLDARVQPLTQVNPEMRPQLAEVVIELCPKHQHSVSRHPRTCARH